MSKTVDDYVFSIIPGENPGDIARLIVAPELCRKDLDAVLALALSIKKHRFIVDNKKEMSDWVSDGASNTCALCKFVIEVCEDCIIGQASGADDCRGTPYWDGGPEDELAFLLALQEGGVEAGREWLAAWLPAWQDREKKDEQENG